MKIQIIGLPCTGKTTYIKRYLEEYTDITYIDINNYTNSNKQREYKNAILKASGKVIAESACGVSLRNTEVVRLETDVRTLYQRNISRDKNLDEDYLSLLRGQMIPAKYTITNWEAFKNILDQLLTR